MAMLRLRRYHHMMEISANAPRDDIDECHEDSTRGLRSLELAKLFYRLPPTCRHTLSKHNLILISLLL